MEQPSQSTMEYFFLQTWQNSFPSVTIMATFSLVRQIFFANLYDEGRKGKSVAPIGPEGACKTGCLETCVMTEFHDIVSRIVRKNNRSITGVP
jgi:hypothetical protein